VSIGETRGGIAGGGVSRREETLSRRVLGVAQHRGSVI